MRQFNIGIFKEYLNQEIKSRHMKRSTAEDYVRKLVALNDSLPVDFNCEELADCIDYLSSLSGSTQARKYINAVKKYEKGVINCLGVCLYGAPLAALYKKYKPTGIVEIQHERDTYLRKINGISNKEMRLKLALRLQLKSGLRVFEVAELTKDDIHFIRDQISIQVNRGKGGKKRLVSVLPDKWLYDNLQQYISTCMDTHPFPNTRAIEEFAKAIDIRTHDLRKVYARVLYRNLRSEGKTMAEARKKVGLQLGHDGSKAGAITNLYLGREWKYGRAKKVKEE